MMEKWGKKDILAILSLFFIAFLIRVVGVSNVCIYLDEFFYWVITNQILASNFAPTAEVFKSASPIFPYIAAVVTLLFEGGLYHFRMISVIFGSLTVPLLYLFGKTMYDRKTGLFAALFLCFSAYHCLYSRIFKIEASALFFITAFLYFFWLSEKQKSTTYAIVAGAMMGLAIAIKYLPIFLVLAVLIYVLWTKGISLKTLLDKRIILTLIFAFLFFSPMLICFFTTGANPAYTYAVEIPERRSSIMPRGYTTPASELLIGGIDKVNEILSWDAGFLTAPWTVIFKLSTILLFLITIFSYLPQLIKRERRSSFLTISIFSLCVLILAFITIKYYLMYLLPFYFVMLSHTAVESFNDLRRSGNSYKNIFRVFVISLTVVMLFSYFVIGVTSPYHDEGERSWVKSDISYIKDDVIKNGYEGDILIGRIGLKRVIEYNIYLCDLNASTVSIVKPGSKYGERVEMDLEKIDRLKPDYLIVNEDQYNTLFKSDEKKEIFENYTIVFRSETYLNGFVLKRKNVQPSELLPRSGEGKIFQAIFKRSVPSVMKVGKVYTALIKIKNTGDSRTNFIVKSHSEKFVIFMEGLHEVTLDKGSSRILKFKIVPNKEYVGELSIRVDLYAEYEECIKKIDSSTDYVYLIER